MGFKMNESKLNRLKNLNTRMKTIINELERLEDYDFLDEIYLTYGKLVRECENRREVVQRSKYG